jgi:hypothetical protein
VSEWTDTWLAVIAVATGLMALLQVGAVVGGALVVRRLLRLTAKVEHDLQPLVERVNTIGADAARISALATQQAERADQLFASVSRRVDHTLGVVQSAVVAPAREGMAIVGAIRSVIDAFRRPARPRRRDDDDPLFIG